VSAEPQARGQITENKATFVSTAVISARPTLQYHLHSSVAPTLLHVLPIVSDRIFNSTLPPGTRTCRSIVRELNGESRYSIGSPVPASVAPSTEKTKSVWAFPVLTAVRKR